MVSRRTFLERSSLGLAYGIVVGCTDSTGSAGGSSSGTQGAGTSVGNTTRGLTTGASVGSTGGGDTDASSTGPAEETRWQLPAGHHEGYEPLKP